MTENTATPAIREPDTAMFARCLQAQADFEQLMDESYAAGAFDLVNIDGGGEPTEEAVDTAMGLVAGHPNADDINALMVARALTDAINRVADEYDAEQAKAVDE